MAPDHQGRDGAGLLLGRFGFGLRGGLPASGEGGLEGAGLELRARLPSGCAGERKARAVSVGEARGLAEVEATGESLASAGIGVFIAGSAGEFLWMNAALAEAIHGLPGRSLDDILEGGWGTRGSAARAPWPRPGAPYP